MSTSRHRLLLAPIGVLVWCLCVEAVPAAPGSGPGRIEKQSREVDRREVLGLAECYRLTVARSESDLIRQEDIRLAEARYRAALGGFVPELGFFASKVYNDEIAASRDPARNPARDLEGGRIATDPTSYLYRRTPTANPFFSGAFVRVPLFNGFRNYYDSGALRMETERQRLLRTRAREILYQDLAAIFFQIQEYEATLALLADESRAFEERVRTLSRDRRLGRARPSELLTARADLATSRAEAENATGIRSVSRELLAFLIGRSEKEWRLADEAAGPSAAALEAYLRTANDRKDVLAALHAVRGRRESVRSARAGHLPSVSLEGSYYLKQAPDTGRDWMVSLRLELPLFSGGRTVAATDAGLAELRASELDLSRVRRSVRYEVRAAYAGYLASAARALLLDEAAALYEEAHEAMRTEYRYGLVRNLEVLDAVRRHYSARRAAIQARFAARVALVRLHVSVGSGAGPRPGLKPVAAEGKAR